MLPRGRLCENSLANYQSENPRQIALYPHAYQSVAALGHFFSPVFANFAPAVTFAFFLDSSTEGMIGVVEVLLSSSVCGTIYAILAGQPLIIVGVTGPTSVFVTTIYGLSSTLGVPFLPFLGWTTLWSAAMHIAIAIGGLCSLVTIITRFSCEVFGALIAIVYFWNGIAELVKSFDTAFPVGLCAALLAILTLYLALVLTDARTWRFWTSALRGFVADYAMPISVTLATVVAAAILPLLPGSESTLDLLPTLNVPYSKPFLSTTNGRPWLVDFGALPMWAIFASAIAGAVLTILFYFDHNVSSLLSQRPESNLMKPPAFNWDFLVLGLTMIPCAVLGLPACNGLIPQAPLHVAALSKKTKSGITLRVAEQRLSPLLQALLTFVVLAPPLLRVVTHVPRAVLAGLFLAMGVHSLLSNQFATRVASIGALTEQARAIVLAPRALLRVPRKQTIRFTIIQSFVLAVTVAVTESHHPVALAFPVIIAALVPFRFYILPRIIEPRWLAILDCEDDPDLQRPVEPQPDTSESPLLEHTTLQVEQDSSQPKAVTDIPLARFGTA
ncbi:HCO3 transporter family-domain-containing protein [Powellomyces hirtus]|nr:HCO3 transporter family-domain-containing protein [Powellomyces hirtus]